MTISATMRRAAAHAGVDELTGWTRSDEDPARAMTFYLGTHRPSWLETSPVPLFVSARTLARYAVIPNPDAWWPCNAENLPKARCLWALDSGGFTELSQHGEWTMDEDTYGSMVYRFMEDVGVPMFAAPQDWMCEPWIIAKTGLTVEEHQLRTVENFLYLRENFYHAPWIPVLQGWTLADYLRCAEMYEAAGVDLADEYRVGLGSVCRRQSTDEIGAIAGAFASRGYKLHGFGVKAQGLERYGHLLASADSLAWSYGARMEDAKLPGCEHAGPCNNCLAYALSWRERTLDGLRAPQQTGLDIEW